MLEKKPKFKRKELFIIDSLFLCSTSSLSSTIRHKLGQGKPEEALPHLLKWQKRALTPDKFTIPSLLKLSSALQEPLLHGEHLHALALKSGHAHDLFVSTGLVEMYFTHSQFDAPRRLFDEVSEKDVAFFTSMISGFAQNRIGLQALEFFSKMLEEGVKPNRITVATVLSASSQIQHISLGTSIHGYSLKSGLVDGLDVILQTSLLNLYAKSGNLIYAQRMFDEMIERNSVSWNLIMEAYFTSGSFEAVLDLFKQTVKTGRRLPCNSMLTLVLRICGISTDLRKGKEVHGYILRTDIYGAKNLFVCNSIVDMYVKAGSLESAISLFDRMPERNVVTWTTMISGYGVYGLTIKAVEAFDDMKVSGVSPDGVAFIAILSACSHGGLVEEGRKIFHSMKRDFGIVPEMKHYVCMVDLYGRAGLVSEAFEFVKMMPVEPSKFIWGSLLSSCRKHKNLTIGKLASNKAMLLDQCDSGNYVLLCRIYADAGKWEEVAKVRWKMKELGVTSTVALSWVEMKGRVHRFTVNDCSSPASIKIYEFLKNLTRMVEKSGYVADTSNAAHNVNEEQKLSDLCGHTEKLALAFSLIGCGEKKIIRIGKNLRVCGDCHDFFKVVSRIYKRDIVLKDPNRDLTIIVRHFVYFWHHAYFWHHDIWRSNNKKSLRLGTGQNPCCSPSSVAFDRPSSTPMETGASLNVNLAKSSTSFVCVAVKRAV